MEYRATRPLFYSRGVQKGRMWLTSYCGTELVKRHREAASGSSSDGKGPTPTGFHGMKYQPINALHSLIKPLRNNVLKLTPVFRRPDYPQSTVLCDFRLLCLDYRV